MRAYRAHPHPQPMRIANFVNKNVQKIEIKLQHFQGYYFMFWFLDVPVPTSVKEAKGKESSSDLLHEYNMIRNDGKSIDFSLHSSEKSFTCQCMYFTDFLRILTFHYLIFYTWTSTWKLKNNRKF